MGRVRQACFAEMTDYAMPNMVLDAIVPMTMSASPRVVNSAIVLATTLYVEDLPCLLARLASWILNVLRSNVPILSVKDSILGSFAVLTRSVSLQMSANQITPISVQPVNPYALWAWPIAVLKTTNAKEAELLPYKHIAS